jgi:hypothetical protein
MEGAAPVVGKSIELVDIPAAFRVSGLGFRLGVRGDAVRCPTTFEVYVV